MGSQPLDEIQVDLAIIGGGPTGLLTGLLAERLGVSICIIDNKNGPLELGRADALNARTQQYLEVVKILDELLPQGITCNTSSTFADGDFKSRQSHWWTGLEYAQRKNFLMLGQPVIEKALADHLTTPVCFGERVVAIAEDNTGVTTTTDRGRTIRSKYAVAADGARSTVRRELGLAFTGTKPEMIWAVLDTFIDTDFPVCPEIITFQLNGQSRVSWIPRERGMARFYVLLDGEITQGKAENSIRAHMAPHRVDFKRTEWFSTFEIKERIASSFISQNGGGRIFLAGDAAHVHSVNGGQGLNTGIADAFALAWRLATAIKNTTLSADAVQKLTQSYDVERRTVAQGVIDVAATLVRDTVHTAKQYVSTIERNAGYITGMGVSYDGISSPLVTESAAGIWKAGRRCPDIELFSSSCQTQANPERLYSLVTYGRYLVLMIGGKENRSDVGLGRFKDAASLFYIGPHRGGPGQGNATEKITDSTVEPLHFSADFVSNSDSYTVVVRPDMYIGYVGQGDHWVQYLSDLV